MDQFACGYVINFNDDGESEEQVLHIGSREECEKTGKLFQAVSYSGSRPVKNCEFRVVPISTEKGGRDG